MGGLDGFKVEVFQKLANGIVGIHELRKLDKLLEKSCNKSASIEDYIEWECFKQLLKKILSIKINSKNPKLIELFTRYYTNAEFQRFKSTIDVLKIIVSIYEKTFPFGDYISPQVANLKESEYLVSKKTLIHLLVRHNQSVNYSILSDKFCSSNSTFFSAGVLIPVILLFNLLNDLTLADWKLDSNGKNLITTVTKGEIKYKIVRNGITKEIKTFYVLSSNQTGWS